jgi:hypothetical protein
MPIRWQWISRQKHLISFVDVVSVSGYAVYVNLVLVNACRQGRIYVVMRSQRFLTNRLSKFSGSYSNFPVTRPYGQVRTIRQQDEFFCACAARLSEYHQSKWRQDSRPSATSLEVLYQDEVAAGFVDLREQEGPCRPAKQRAPNVVIRRSERPWLWGSSETGWKISGWRPAME